MEDEGNPSIEDNNIKILRVNAGHFNGEVNKALAARATSFSAQPLGRHFTQGILCRTQSCLAGSSAKSISALDALLPTTGQ
jgi:hypothetical protein